MRVEAGTPEPITRDQYKQDLHTYVSDQYAPYSLPVSLFPDMSSICRFRRFPMEAVKVPGKGYGVEVKGWTLKMGRHTPCTTRETLRWKGG